MPNGAARDADMALRRIAGWTGPADGSIDSAAAFESSHLRSFPTLSFFLVDRVVLSRLRFVACLAPIATRKCARRIRVQSVRHARVSLSRLQRRIVGSASASRTTPSSHISPRPHDMGALLRHYPVWDPAQSAHDPVSPAGSGSHARAVNVNANLRYSLRMVQRRRLRRLGVTALGDVQEHRMASWLTYTSRFPLCFFRQSSHTP
jgi:hypothetical protein